MRFSVDGCVENRLSIPRPESGLMMKRWAVAGCASALSFGTASAMCAILTSAVASASGRPLMRAPRLSAAYSRVRLIAIWTIIAAIGARTSISSDPTAGIGSDHTDLQAAMDKGITVAEVTFSNSISVAEHVVMMILALVRNYIPSYGWVVKGGWNIADSVERSYDLEGMNVGTVAAGRIGLAVMRRLKPFGLKLHYTDKHRLPKEVEEELGATYHSTVESLVKVCDVVTINAPLHPETEHMFNDKLIGMMKRGSYIVNTARAKIVDRDAVVRALESGRLAGYAGDVWFPQPPAKDHPWRTMPHHGMTPHISGSSLSAQARYAAGTREILESYFAGKLIRTEYLIVDKGKLAGAGAHSYTKGDATKGSEAAVGVR